MKYPHLTRILANDESPTEKFMKEFWDKTAPHPFDHTQRIYNNETILQLRPWRGGPGGSESVHLNWIQALEPKEGQGTRAMQFLSNLADKHQVLLDLNAVPKGQNKMPVAKLKNFYRKFGFVSTPGDNMRRNPK